MTPDFDPATLMAKLMSSSGWDNIEPSAKSIADDRRRQAAELRKEADVIAAPFRSEAGQRCLMALAMRTLMRPLIAMPIEGASPEQQAMYAAFRQGQNQIVIIIVNALATASDVKPAVAVPLEPED